ncbi:hypothetical protein [Salinispora arenicola]|uniref:Uncharacterized protein n=1 Tax=Salinispora arenicola TaxID=168697 RepID=A0A542XLQ3_SALAC|nr:hypothetical protein [Salinispora arenicola]TQL36573.1 hypothetical protein FB564_1676 [Salinispora arenicola]GIM83351.1 hypothetical protein Sar04_11770 [Salinispora arenicola]
MQPPAGSQVSRLPAQRPPSDQLAPPLPEPAPVRPRQQRVRTILTVTAAVLTALVLGGIVGGYVLYDRATTPDRSAPDVVVDNYLRAYLVDRNDIRADLYICEEQLDLTAMAALRAEILDRETKFDVDVRVSWGSLKRLTNQQGESVTTTLSISSSSNGVPRSGRYEDWTFNLVQDSAGWRVCGGQKAG